MKKVLTILMIAGLVFLQSVALFATGKQETLKPSGKRMKFYVVSHGGPADPFWGVVMRGAKDAGKMFNVDVTYSGPEKFSIQKLVNMVETAVAAKPDGLIVTITDQKALDKPLKDAIKKGIPVVAINVPDTRSFPDKIPYLCYVGADDYKVGIAAANRMLQAFSPGKPKRGVILIHEVGHTGLELRAKGITEVFSKLGIPVERLAGTPNSSENYQALDAYLTKHPDTDAVFTLGPIGCLPALKLFEDKNLFGKIKLGGVDLTTRMTDAIKKGELLFTVEQQQYLQGYLPVGLLVLYNKYGLIPHGDILTGPAIVDKSNVDIVSEMVKKKYR